MASRRCWLLALLPMTLALWMWTRPLSLPVADSMAERALRAQVRRNVLRSQPSPLPAAVDTLTEDWIARNRAQFDTRRAQLADHFRDSLTYEADDGKRYPYLGDMDSYAWLREARNVVRTGKLCDAVVNGECRDAYVYAPLGGAVPYTSGVHVAAIVAVHRIANLLHHGYPLPASAMLVPIIVMVLAAIPAFGIGRSLGGTLGGVLAAVLITCDAGVFVRSFGSDNDAWNVALPLWTVWAVVAALHATSARRRGLWAVTAGCIATLHALTWLGWVFAYLVVLAALLALTGLRMSRWFLLRLASAYHGTGAVALVGIVFYVTTGLLTVLTGAERSYTGALLPSEIVSAVRSKLGPPLEATDGNLYPDALRTVSELQSTDLAALAETVGGKLVLYGSLLGLVLLTLPRGCWRRTDMAIALGGAGLCGVVLAIPGLRPVAAARLCALPVAAALLAGMLHRDLPPEEHPGGELVVVVWLLAGMLQAGHVRFMFLLVPAVGLAFGAAVGRLGERLSRGMQHKPRYAAAIRVLVYCAGAVLLIQPVRQGYTVGLRYAPQMSDVWWNSLTKIRDHSAPDSIVSTWWDYGYWVKYAAERRVNADGSSLLTHVPYWLARVLASDSEREMFGMLRMLDCASDATPHPEGSQGAFGKIRAHVHDAFIAQSMVLDLVSLDRTAAAAYLGAHGFTPAAQEDVLAATHCVPPEAYVVLSDDLAQKDAWLHLGLWDFRKAAIAQLVQQQPAPVAIRMIAERFNFTEGEAATLDRQARSLSRDDFVTPHAVPASARWIPCSATADGTIWHCRMALMSKTKQEQLYDFTYQLAAPQRSRLRVVRVDGGTRDTASEGSVGTLIVAGERGLQDVPFSSPTFPAIAVLVDLARQRVLTGSLPALHSMFTQLFFLDGRYTTHFEKFDDRVSELGHVMTWKIKWESGA
ncbi:MAG: STT3 domain-containing protein [Candidatus Binatia bacterium]